MAMETNNAIIIVGGGLAGLTAAIHLSKIGFPVILFEKNKFPKHKVCGEYISNEVLPYLKWLDLTVSKLKPASIEKLQFSAINGNTLDCLLPLGGFGISRYTLDNFLYHKALANGCTIIQDSVKNVSFKENQFTVTTSNNSIFKSEIVIGAFGKYSNLDHDLNRSFAEKRSRWLAVKAHYKGDFQSNLVGVYTFKGGYCGVSKVEKNHINICYLADYASFKEYKNIPEYQNQVVLKNPLLKEIFDTCELIFEKPLTISQIHFDKKEIVENHMLMIGDSAGLIHPLCGNGMAMAIHSAKIVSELVEQFYSNEIETRAELEKKYIREWNFTFSKRLKAGRILSKILNQEKLSNILIRIMVKFPFLLSTIIKKTHGKPLSV